MAHWLMKSEPTSYSWDDLVRDGATEWDGVRNNAARLHLKAMKPGDEAFFYHSMSDKAVVGIMRVTRGAEPDPKAPDWVRVRVEPVRQPLHLSPESFDGRRRKATLGTLQGTSRCAGGVITVEQNHADARVSRSLQDGLVYALAKQRLRITSLPTR